MDPSNYFFFAIFAFVVGNFVFRFIRYGGLKGALIGGRIERTIGEVSLSKSGMSSRTLKVQTLQPNAIGERPGIAVSIINKAPLGVHMIPFKLTAAEAQDLARLLQQACGGPSV